MYLIRADGSSIFETSMPYDFLLHCYYIYTERTNERLFFVDFRSDESCPIPLLACDGTFVT